MKSAGISPTAGHSSLPDGKAVIYTVGYQGMTSADDAIIEAISLETGEQKVIHEGGYYARYVPTGHLVFIRDGTLFGMTFDARRLEPTGSPAPLVQGITTNNGPGGAQYSFSDTGDFAYVSGEVGVPTYPIVWVDKERQIHHPLGDARFLWRALTLPGWQEARHLGPPRQSMGRLGLRPGAGSGDPPDLP